MATKGLHGDKGRSFQSLRLRPRTFMTTLLLHSMHRFSIEEDFHRGVWMWCIGGQLWRVATMRMEPPFKFMDLRMERIVHACPWLPLEVAVPALFAAISQPGMCNLVSWDDGPERTAGIWPQRESVNQERLLVLVKECWMLYLTNRDLYREVPFACIENS